MRDRPEAPGGAGRDPLGDLRERLARLPAGHPSSPQYRPAQEHDRVGDAAAGELAGGELAGGELAGGELGEGGLARDELAGDELAGDDEAAGEAPSDRQQERDGPDGTGAAGPDEAGRARSGQSPPRDQGSGLPRRGEPYRPWFSSGDSPEPCDSPEPWFSPDPGDRSG